MIKITAFSYLLVLYFLWNNFLKNWQLFFLSLLFLFDVPFYFRNRLLLHFLFFFKLFLALTSSPNGTIFLKQSLEQNENTKKLLKPALSTSYLLSSCSYQKNQSTKRIGDLDIRQNLTQWLVRVRKIKHDFFFLWYFLCWILSKFLLLFLVTLFVWVLLCL